MTATTSLPTKTELWRQLVAVDRLIAQTPVCTHYRYRYAVKGCDWCERNAEADRLTRLMDRLDALGGVA